MAGIETAAREIGLWWPTADEEGLRQAALAWEDTATALDTAARTGRSGAEAVGATWRGAAAERFAQGWHDHERALADDATGCRTLAQALRGYADAVADAKRRIERMAVLAGASLVAGAGLAWLTFGASAGVAAGVSAGLVAAAEAVGVELSVTAATLVGATVSGVGFGAAEAAVVDMAVTQPVRVEVFGDGGYSAAEVAGSATAGGALGGLSGGVAAGARAVRAARTDEDPGAAVGWPQRRAVEAGADLYELDGVISAALDPAHRGALGPLFRAGVHETPTTVLAPAQRPAAQLLAAEGRSLHARALPGSSPGVLVRRSAADPGRLAELAHPEAPTPEAVADAILDAGGRLARHGAGDLVLDGRGVGLDVDAAGEGLSAAVERAEEQGLTLPESIRFVVEGGSIHYP